MDLRDKVNNLLNEYGNYCLLIRNGNTIRCSCWDDKTEEADGECEHCFGQGYLSVIEKHISRNTIASIPETLARASKQQDYERVASQSRVYYFKYKVKPRIGDLVVNCDFDKHGLPILDHSQVLEINAVDSLRGDRGRIEFVKAYCSMQPLNTRIKVSNIRKVGINVVFDGGVINE
jgi:hypothetical protein